MREGWHFRPPFIVLVGGLLWLNWEPEYAALFGTAALIVLALVVPHKGKRMTIGEVTSSLVSAGGAVIDIIAITAIAGILIGAMNLTGVAFSLTQQTAHAERRQPRASPRHHGVRRPSSSACRCRRSGSTSSSRRSPRPRWCRPASHRCRRTCSCYSMGCSAW